MLTDAVRLLLFPALMAFAASSDLLTMTISNRLSLALTAAFFLMAAVTGMSLHSFGLHLAAGALVLAFSFVFFTQGWIGGGDAKLAAVTALWFAPDQALLYFIYAAFLGGVLTLGILQIRTGLLPMALYRVPWIAQLHDSRTGVPYGAAMAPAALIVFPDTAWVTHTVF